MAESTYYIIQVLSKGDYAPQFTLAEVARRCGLHPELIERFIRLGLIEFIGRTRDGQMLFDSEVIPLVRRILRLRNDLGVNYAGVGVILELMSRVELLETRIRELEGLLE